VKNDFGGNGSSLWVLVQDFTQEMLLPNTATEDEATEDEKERDVQSATH
jgi:hypothetical protein